MTMNWFIFAICATTLWGVGQVFIKRGLSGVSPFYSNLFATIAALVVEIPFALIGGVKWEYFPFIFGLALLASLPNYIFPYVVEKANVSLSGTVLATYPVYTILLSILFLKESLDGIQLLGILGIIIGMFLVAKPENERLKWEGWVIWAVLGSVAIGFGDFMGKVALTQYNLYSFVLALTLSGVISLVITRIFDKKPARISGNRKGIIYSLIGNFLMPMGLLFLYIAFSKGPASLVSPVASTYPAITVILAYFYLKEKITKTNLAGIILTTVGVVLIGI
jgi:uncharacterized membrane protein